MKWLLPLTVLLLLPTTATAVDRAAISYRRYCRNCHDPRKAGQTPSITMLRRMSAEAVLKAMEKGTMKPVAEPLTKEQRRALAEYVAGKKLGDRKSPEKAGQKHQNSSSHTQHPEDTSQ